MTNETILSIRGVPTTLTELHADVEAAKAKGLSGQFAFMPETVEALLDCIKELQGTQFVDKPAKLPIVVAASIIQWISLISVCKEHLKIEPQFAIRYISPYFSTTEAFITGHNTLCCSYGLRIIGDFSDYRTIMIHPDDVSEFIERVRESKKN